MSGGFGVGLRSHTSDQYVKTNDLRYVGSVDATERLLGVPFFQYTRSYFFVRSSQEGVTVLTNYVVTNKVPEVGTFYTIV